MCGIAGVGFGAEGVFRHVDAFHVRSCAIEFDGSGNLAVSSGVDFWPKINVAQQSTTTADSTAARLYRYVIESPSLNNYEGEPVARFLSL